MDLDPVFPPELEREIFEHAATLYPNVILNLLVVARVRPMLYRTIMVKPGAPPLAAFMRIIDAMPASSSFFRDSVHNLFVHQTPWLAAELQTILATCPGITNLAMMSTTPAVLPLLASKRLTRLALSLAQLFGSGPGGLLPHLAHPIFAHTTHLGLFDYVQNEAAWGAFARLPALTHLCLHSFVHRAQLRSVLTKCPRLQVLVNMHTNTEPEWGLADICGRLKLGDDPRFVLIALDQSVNAYARDWETGRRGEKDFWFLADAFVEKKRRGEIKPGQLSPSTPLQAHRLN